MHSDPRKSPYASLRVFGVILLLVVVGMNVGERSSIRSVLNAPSREARQEASAQAGVDLVVAAIGVALIAVDFLRRRRPNRR